MKTLTLIFWILLMVVWPVSVNADNSQNIVFTGTYSFNNEATDADSAWLFIRYDGTLVDSTKITPEDLQWDGYYQYIHACTNDSVWGWSGWWIYFDGSAVSLPELATVATARDSSYALEASVTALRDTAQYLVTSDGDTINRAASVLVASDNIGINAADVDDQFAAADFDVPYYITVGYYTWETATKEITGASDGFYEILGDTIRPIFGDSIPALMDSIYRQMDSLYAIMDSLATQAWWSTSDCEGVGVYTCTLYVTDTLNDWRLAFLNVSINNQLEDGLPRVVQAGADGYIIVQYSDGDYRATVNTSLYRNNEGGSPFLDFTVDGAPLLDSIMGYLQSVGTPESAEVCSVYSWVYDVASVPVAGATIIFDLISDQDTLYYDNVTYVPGRTITESNSDGYWSIGVVPNELLDTLSFYSVDIIRDHTRKPILEHYDVYVPDSTTVILNDLLINFNRGGK